MSALTAFVLGFSLGGFLTYYRAGREFRALVRIIDRYHDLVCREREAREDEPEEWMRS